MNTCDQERVKQACLACDNDPARLMDILWGVQDHLHFISPASITTIAEQTGLHKVEVEGVASFYAFFHQRDAGQHQIYLCDDIIDQLSGYQALYDFLLDYLECPPGETSPDGLISWHNTPCIGMSDQAPAAIIDQIVFVNLCPSQLRQIIDMLRSGASVETVRTRLYSGQSKASHHAHIQSNIRRRGKVHLSEHSCKHALTRALSMQPVEVVDAIEQARLRGRGGAGFPIANKWLMARDNSEHKRYLICNADEGEPGTFKDRVLLTEYPERLFTGMIIAAWAIGADEGILYLRAEYRYLHTYLEQVLERMRARGDLGKDLLVDTTEAIQFSFDIRIQLGAGAYICGEESALIASCEGRRGEPANKPPFPTQHGYHGKPTVVNNVETLCAIVPIMEHGPQWFCSMGTKESKGTKLYSISGDCNYPGVYEYEFGIRLKELLRDAGAEDAQAVQVGGASGILIGPADFDRQLSFEDMPCAGAIMVFNSQRNILEIVNYFMRFFIEESCGYCTPCRVGTVFMQKSLQKVIDGCAEAADLDYLCKLSNTVAKTSRCGLGHAAPNPLISSMQNFPLVYSALLKASKDGRQAGFDIQQALQEARVIAKRRSLIYDPDFGNGYTL